MIILHTFISNELSKVLHTFISNELFGQLLDNSPENFIFKKILILNFYVLKYGLLVRHLNR